MRQFLVAEARSGAVLEIEGPDYHYLVRVLRLGAGDVIPVADAAGHRTRATITAVADGRVRLLVAGSEAAHGTAPGGAAAAALTLVQALPRGALMDRIVRQATELGVSAIVPVVAERTQGRPDPAAQRRRRERWQRIARQAAQQSGSPPPAIEMPVPLPRHLEDAPAGGIGLLFEPGAAPIGALAASRPDGAPPIRCAVGPEGGYSPAEVALFRARGYHPVGLVAGLLRVDTAVVAALTVAAQFLAARRP